MPGNSNIVQNNTSERLNRTPDQVKVPDQLPQQLLVSGIVNPEQWNQMNIHSKVALLEQHLGENWAEIVYGKRVEYQSKQPENIQKSPERQINVAELKEHESIKKEFEAAKQDLERELTMDRQNKQVEMQDMSQPQEEQLTQEEKARIETERGARGVKGVFYKFFGYQPSDDIVQNYEEIAEKGAVSDASTWLATLLSKIFAVKE